jgi:hypothetical protein
MTTRQAIDAGKKITRERYPADLPKILAFRRHWPVGDLTPMARKNAVDVPLSRKTHRRRGTAVILTHQSGAVTRCVDVREAASVAGVSEYSIYKMASSGRPSRSGYHARYEA